MDASGARSKAQPQFHALSNYCRWSDCTHCILLAAQMCLTIMWPRDVACIAPRLKQSNSATSCNFAAEATAAHSPLRIPLPLSIVRHHLSRSRSLLSSLCCLYVDDAQRKHSKKVLAAGDTIWTQDAANVAEKCSRQ